MIMTLSSPMMTPVLGSPSAVKAQRSRPISVKEIFFSVRSPCDANCLAMPALPSLLCGGSGVLNNLLDRTEDGMTSLVLHLDADGVAKPHEGRFRAPLLDG